MIYKKFQDMELSALGMGCMRLPRKDGGIDEEAVERMVQYALDHGVNYFDTAWGYHDGQSEPVMGRILKRHPRERFYVATKFPGFDVKNMERAQEIFEKQLERLQVDYFDFYLFHNVAEKNVDAFLDPKYGVVDYLLEQKRQGRIRHLGFSAHGDLATIRRFLEACNGELEFCQLQVNWLDWTFQDARAKLELLREFHVPLWVMEPVRGGSLAVLREEYMSRLEALRPGVSAPEWAFRFLQSIPEVGMILSGMSNDEQLAENIRTFEEEKPLNEAEWDALQKIAADMTAANYLPCTACRYCMEQCPKKLPIPFLLELYSDPCRRPGEPIPRGAIGFLAPEARPDQCIGCRACEAVCPQNIAVSEVLADFTGRLV